MDGKTKKLTTLGMLSAIAFALVVVGRIPVVLFLKYDPKDVIIAIGGMLYGPLSAFIISAAVSFVEMFTISDTGIIGFIMNVISSCAFACTAAYIYKKDRTLKGAVIGLVSGAAVMVAVMLLWNYLVTPIYMGYPRQAIVDLMLPAFLPFNLIKGGLNAAITMLLYKPIVSALRSSHLIEEGETQTKGKINIGVVLVSLFVIATCVFFVLSLQKII